MLSRTPAFVATLASAVAVSFLTFAPAALAGSIVINEADPNGVLQMRDESGRVVKTLAVSWSELQLISKVRGYLVAKHGEPGRTMPYMIDKQEQTVSVLVDRAAGRYEKVTFGQLVDY